MVYKERLREFILANNGNLIIRSIKASFALKKIALENNRPLSSERINNEFNRCVESLYKREIISPQNLSLEDISIILDMIG